MVRLKKSRKFRKFRKAKSTMQKYRRKSNKRQFRKYKKSNYLTKKRRKRRKSKKKRKILYGGMDAQRKKDTSSAKPADFINITINELFWMYGININIDVHEETSEDKETRPSLGSDYTYGRLLVKNLQGSIITRGAGEKASFYFHPNMDYETKRQIRLTDKNNTFKTWIEEGNGAILENIFTKDSNGFWQHPKRFTINVAEVVNA